MITYVANFAHFSLRNTEVAFVKKNEVREMRKAFLPHSQWDEQPKWGVGCNPFQLFPFKVIEDSHTPDHCVSFLSKDIKEKVTILDWI